MKETNQPTVVEGVPLLGIVKATMWPLIEYDYEHWKWGLLFGEQLIARGIHLPAAGFSGLEFEVERGAGKKYLVFNSSSMRLGWEGQFPPKVSRFGDSVRVWVRDGPQRGLVQFKDVESTSTLAIWTGYEERGSRCESVGNNCLAWKLIGENEWRIWGYAGVELPTLDSIQLRLRLLRD
ncbi:MAG: hypothetical protein JSS66_08145 [Armatimonadetes bacterium]|nr:hypothetical protein [Armatimonadota bacterium]